MKKIFSFLYCFLFFTFFLKAQNETGGFAWGFKTGLTMATQKWNGSNRDPLLRYHGVLFIESNDSEKSALFAQIGYHIRGSATRYGPFVDPATGNTYKGFTQGYQFKNFAISVGAKQKKDFRENLKYFYSFGIRGEFSAKNNLPAPGSGYGAYFPSNDPNTVKRFVGGFDMGGGFEMKLSELVGGIFQVTISPDLTRQYYQLPINNVRNPYTGQKETIPLQDIRNLSLELSIGLKFLRKVIYVD